MKSKKPSFSYAKRLQIHTDFRLKTETAIEIKPLLYLVADVLEKYFRK